MLFARIDDSPMFRQQVKNFNLDSCIILFMAFDRKLPSLMII